jgi:hypothetical protein
MTSGHETSPMARLNAALQDPGHMFTRDQVAYLMAAAQRWGYEARLAEENEQFLAAEPISLLGTWYDQAQYRKECDRVASLPRINDYQGGPVSWDADTSARNTLPASEHKQMGRVA